MSDPDTIANQSAEADHAHATGGSSVNQIRITDRKGFLVATALALSILVNLWTGFIISGYKTEKRLQEYDLDWFKSQDFAQLKGEVSAHDKLIMMLQVRKECLR
jgi:hypothetical protein